jgi:hypothetical protein
MRFKHYILEPGTLDEASYSGNIGFEELSKFYKAASNEQKKEMDKILEREDWNAFKNLIRKVVDIKLK